MKCIALLVLALAGISFAQNPGVQNDTVGLEYPHKTKNHTSNWFIGYVRYENEPAFRVRAHHYHAWCNGDLYITPTRVVYTPTLTPWQKDGVTLVRRELSAATPRYAGYSFSSGAKTYHFAFLSEQQPGMTSTATDGRQAMMKMMATALTDFPSAERQFMAMLTGIRLENNGVLAVPSRPSISVLQPAGAKGNLTVNADSAIQIVAGVAAARGGISAVTVNGVPARISPLAVGIVEFRGQPIALKPGTSPVSVRAVANNGDATEVAFRTLTPEIRITDPEAGTPTADETVRIHGLIIGMPNAETVQLAGQMVTVHKSPLGTLEFTLTNVSLNMGSNVLPGYVVFSDGRRQTFSTTILRTTPAPPPYSFEQIEGGLRHGLTNARLGALVKQAGVDFALTPELEHRLRKAGANKTLIEAISSVAQQ